MKAKGPEFIRFFKPILQILKQSGGSGTTSEVIDRAIELLQIPESEQEVALKNGQSRVRNQVQWARLYLVRAGYLDSSRRGIWSLTEKGTQTELAAFDPHDVFQVVQKGLQAEKKMKELQERNDSEMREREEVVARREEDVVEEEKRLRERAEVEDYWRPFRVASASFSARVRRLIRASSRKAAGRSSTSARYANSIGPRRFV